MEQIKLQVGFFIVIMLLTFLYFPTKKKNPEVHLHRSFAFAITAVLAHIIAESVNLIFLGNMDFATPTVKDWTQKICEITMFVSFYLFYIHISFIIDKKIKPNVPNTIVSLFGLGAVLTIIVIPVSFNFLFGIPVGSVLVTSSALDAVMITFTLIRVLIGKAGLVRAERLTMTLTLIAEYIALLIQIFFPFYGIGTIGLTVMILVFYFILENPSNMMLERVKKEKARADAANAAKSKFVSVVSHEIRTPMNAVVGMTDLLLKTDVNDKQKKYLENMKRSGQALVSIVNDILDSSKIEAGKMELVEKPYDLRALLEDTGLIIRDRVGSKPIEVFFNVDSSIPGLICGDAVRIRQIVINLMNNSVKFTDKGSVSLDVTVEKETDKEYMLRFSVKDTGQGIKPEDLSKLFKAFEQVNKEENHEKEGTGLGLSISSDLIALMGGQLEVASEWGKGSEFFFTVSQKKTEQTQSADAASDNDLTGITVLIVDDTELNLEIEKEILEMNGAKADTALSGSQALEMLRKKQYSIIFTDYVMPEMTGTQLTKAIRALDGEYFRSVPVIAVTGDTSDEAKTEFRQSGVTDFTDKPVDMKKLVGAALKYGKAQ